MLINMKVRNYRCFSDQHPVMLEIGPGLTALVGPNNSGKSSALKFLNEMVQFWGLLADPLRFANSINASFNASPAWVPDPAQLNCDLTGRPPVLEIEVGSDENPTVKLVTTFIGQDPSYSSWSVSLSAGRPIGPVTEASPDSVLARIDGSTNRVGLGPIHQVGKALSKPLYVGPFRNAINAGGGDYYGMPTGSAFIRLWQEMKNGGNRDQRALTYRVVDDLERLFGLDRLEIDAIGDGNRMMVTTARRSYSLHDVGSGFSEFLILLTWAATSNPTILLIDEPELHLHPSLQADLLTTLASYTQTGMVVFATHSLGLARSVADRVLAFSSTPAGSLVRPFESSAGLVEFLGEMSYAAYRELGYETVLLVEGPKEVKAIQQLLRRIRRDHTVVVIPLGGSSMIHGRAAHELAELARLSPDRVFALIDSERSSSEASLSNDRDGFVAACHMAGVTPHVTQRRAFENYLTDAAIKQVLGPNYRALSDFERLSDAERPWHKEDNWRVARRMSWSDIAETDLGQFLAQVVG